MVYRKRDSDSDDEYPLPLASYTTLKDRQLKDMLTEQGLSVIGNRTIWEQRHQRYVYLCAHYSLSQTIVIVAFLIHL